MLKFVLRRILETVPVLLCVAAMTFSMCRMAPGGPFDDDKVVTEEVREFCEGRIAHFKIPKYIKFVEAFPMTVTGKVQKFVMREQMREELAAESGA